MWPIEIKIYAFVDKPNCPFLLNAVNICKYYSFKYTIVWTSRSDMIPLFLHWRHPNTSPLCLEVLENGVERYIGGSDALLEYFEGEGEN